MSAQHAFVTGARSIGEDHRWRWRTRVLPSPLAGRRAGPLQAVCRRNPYFGRQALVVGGFDVTDESRP